MAQSRILKPMIKIMTGVSTLIWAKSRVELIHMVEVVEESDCQDGCPGYLYRRMRVVQYRSPKADTGKEETVDREDLCKQDNSSV